MFLVKFLSWKGIIIMLIVGYFENQPYVFSNNNYVSDLRKVCGRKSFQILWLRITEIYYLLKKK